MTTPLGEKIRAIVQANGPISVTDYFSLCLADPEYGYYKTRDPFGKGGDFITAPEVSQLFGEMIGIFLVHAWQQHLRPSASIRLVEIGPGRGTMMKDILRAIETLAPELYGRLSVHLVETSERLRGVQAQTLAEHREKLAWHSGFDEIPDGFLLLVANEFFDAVPIRQFVKMPNGFRERLVGLDDEGKLAFAAGAAGIDPALLPANHRDVPPGTIFEVAPARAAIMQAIAERIFTSGGTALIIDYGHLAPGFGDTLQAILDHRFDPPLAHPGLADLTSHVDFSVLGAVARHAAIHVNGSMSQGDFLMELGLGHRAGMLGNGKPPEVQGAIIEAVKRLASNDEGQMGDLFKVMAVSSPAIRLAPFEKEAAG